MIEWLDYLGAKITRMVGTMICAVIFLAISLISLPAAIASHDAFVIVSWLSQSFLQLELLPIIMVGQRVTVRRHVDPLREHHERHEEKLDAIIAALAELNNDETTEEG